MNPPKEKIDCWHDISGNPVPKAAPFGIMGIINVTPDSFYAASRCASAEESARRAKILLADGADIIDIGAESTRPGAKPISWQEEMSRIIDAIQAIKEALPRIRLSVDTRNARTAEAALDNGAAIINDVSACGHDPELAEVLMERKPGYVLMHAQGLPETMQTRPRYNNVVEEIMAFFRTRFEKLQNGGLPANRIILDPGIGFGKTAEHNLDILKNISQFLTLGHPLLLGVSMKSLFGRLWGLEMPERAEATATLSALAFQKGCVWHRVHDAKKTRLALQMAAALRQ